MAKWLKAVARENWVPSPRATLCSDHFIKECFEERNDRRHLKFSSVPTIFPPPKNKSTGPRMSSKAAYGGHHKKSSEVEMSVLQAHETLHQPVGPTKVIDEPSALTTDTLNSGRLAQLAAAAVLNLAEFTQVLEVPLKPEAESSEVLAVFNCRVQTETPATEDKMESVSDGLIMGRLEEESQDSAAVLCSDALHWTANVLSRPEVQSDTCTTLVGSVDVSADVLPCLFTSSADQASDRSTISEGTTWISTEVLVPETQTHLSTSVQPSEELQCETVLSSQYDQDLTGITFPQDHSYFMNPCPDIIRRTLEKKLAWERKKNEEQRQRFRVLQQKLKRKEQKIDSLTKIINELRENKSGDLWNSNIL
ncbi:uncharacterized protein LOC144599711 isoform X2 [Rhinoraja longicauda]